MGGWDTIDRALKNRNKVFFKMGMRYSVRGANDHWGGRRTDCDGGEVCYKEVRCVDDGEVHG